MKSGCLAREVEQAGPHQILAPQEEAICSRQEGRAFIACPADARRGAQENARRINARGAAREHGAASEAQEPEEAARVTA